MESNIEGRRPQEVGLGLEQTIASIPSEAAEGVRNVFKQIKDLVNERI